MVSMPSPLFEPVVWEGNSFRILDESLLPKQMKYIGIRNISQAVDAVREMRTRAFGQVLTFLYSGALLAQNHHGAELQPLRDAMNRMIQEFCEARPTFDFRGLGH